MTFRSFPPHAPTRSADYRVHHHRLGAQVVSVIVSNHVSDASTLVPPEFHGQLAPDVSLNLVSLVRTMNGVILIPTSSASSSASLRRRADNKMGGAVLSVHWPASPCPSH